MKSKITYIGLFICMALMSSCSDYLEVENRNSVTDNVLWSEESNADLFLNDMYNDLLPDANKVTQHLDQFSDMRILGMHRLPRRITRQVSARYGTGKRPIKRSVNAMCL